ncbi:MAG: peptide ABC transporter permease [Alphaproteobacteria bacterium]|nr:peptide ABC transporter permease [Alphaproteobacteria bacterium]
MRAERKPITLGAEDARQGRIVLRARWQRAVFIAGLVGAVVVAALVSFSRW